MKPKKTLPLVLMVVMTLVLTLACNALSGLTAGEDVPPTEPPAATEALEPTVVEQQAERVQLDPCTLITEEEVGAVLGGPVQIQPSMGTGGCVYLLQSDDPSVMVQLALSAAQGNEAKAFTVLSLGLLAGFSGDPEIQAGFEEVNSQLPDLTLLETVSRMTELFRGTGVSLTEADGPGEHATWLVYESEYYSQGTLIMVSGDEYVSLTQIGGDMAAAFEQLGNLGRTVFDRLPESFYMLDEDGDGSFSFSLGEEEEPAPTVAPEPTVPPMQGCVPEMVSPLEEASLDNGCQSESESIVWEFEWSECPGAQSYNLFVIGSIATKPVIDDLTPNTKYLNQSSGYIAGQNLLLWRWKVRAMQNDVWGEWTPERTFDVEPLDTDCTTGGGG
ncbi:MAG: DUF3558 domain-containing protein [Anaerolineales bacterium]|nr:DUF3558 domain-containing protein [Anaerolineales bacterium]